MKYKDNKCQNCGESCWRCSHICKRCWDAGIKPKYKQITTKNKTYIKGDSLI